jgi:3-deoxy-7-phosphoheptulonate synthase
MNFHREQIIDDLRIVAQKCLLRPSELIEQFPLDAAMAKHIFESRQIAQEILHGKNDRLLVVVGPCSIHDPESALEYANQLRAISLPFQEKLFIIMRVYFEKPRTTVGWKGLINDPYLDNSFQINDGLRIARKLLLDINKLGLPAGTEYLDVLTPQFIADLISWAAIGARTTESQAHRQLASGLSCPVGFKNGTDGNTRIAIDAIKTAKHPHHFLSVTKEGHTAIFSTAGNEDCHVILRGGNEPNYSAKYVQQVATTLQTESLPTRVMIDCSHANSSKDFKRQSVVVSDIVSQLKNKEHQIMGVMIESNLIEGRQELHPGQSLKQQPLKRGQSITDSCIGMEETERLLNILAEAI